MWGVLLGVVDDRTGARWRKSTKYQVNGGGTTRELAPTQSRPEGPSPIRTDTESLSPRGFIVGSHIGVGMIGFRRKSHGGGSC
jgi:hypothetical protein